MDTFLLLASLAAAGAVLVVGGTPAKKSGKNTAGAVILFTVFIMVLAVIFSRLGDAMPVDYRIPPESVPAALENVSQRALEPVVCVDEERYFLQVESIVEELTGALFTLSRVDGVTDAGRYALRHEAELKAAAFLIREAAVAAHRIKGVPPGERDAHELFCEAMLCYYRSMFYFELGLDALALQSDTAAAVFFELALADMNEGSARLEQALVRWSLF